MMFFCFLVSNCSMCRPPLIAATMDENWQEVMALTKQVPQEDVRDRKGRTPLMVMIEETDLSSAIVEDSNSKSEVLSKALEIMSNKETLVEYEILENLIKVGPDLNAVDKKGRTALMIASKNGYYMVVAMLIDAGVNKDLKDKNGQTALMMTTYKSVRELLEKD